MEEGGLHQTLRGQTSRCPTNLVPSLSFLAPAYSTARNRLCQTSHVVSVNLKALPSMVPNCQCQDPESRTDGISTHNAAHLSIFLMPELTTDTRAPGLRRSYKIRCRTFSYKDRQSKISVAGICIVNGIELILIQACHINHLLRISSLAAVFQYIEHVACVE